MTSLMFLIYFSSVGVAIVLRRQARRHREEMASECERRGITFPRSGPEVQMPGGLACILTGVVIAAPAADAFIQILRNARFGEIMAPETVDFYSFLFAAGLTLISAGCMRLRLNRGFRIGTPEPGTGDAGISSSRPCSGGSASEFPRHPSPPAG